MPPKAKPVLGAMANVGKKSKGGEWWGSSAKEEGGGLGCKSKNPSRSGIVRGCDQPAAVGTVSW